MMKPTNILIFYRFLWVSGIVFAIDRGLKWWAIDQGSFSVNRGFALMIGENATLEPVIVLHLIVCALFFVWWMRKLTQGEDQLSSQDAVAAGLVFGGGVSNLVDRFVFHFVIDNLMVPWVMIRNNIADWAVVVGAVWLAWRHVRLSKQNK